VGTAQPFHWRLAGREARPTDKRSFELITLEFLVGDFAEAINKLVG
jgi:hypothetical protein